MRPIVVSKAGAVAMEASEYFEKHVANKLGLRDVFKMKNDWFNAHRKYTPHEDGSVTIEHVEPEEELEYPSEEEVDNYIRKREEYVASEMLRKCGWTEFVKRCELVGIEDYINEHFPCEGPDGQCNMFCPQYNTDCWGILIVEGNNVSVQQKSVI